MLEFVTSQKGTRKLVVNGSLFNKQSDGSEDKELWRCERRTCKARIHTRANTIVMEVGLHNHVVTHGQVEVERARSNMKRRAETTEESTRSIVQNELLTVPVDVAHLLPKRPTLSRDVRRHRQMGGTSDQQDMSVYSLTKSNQPFIRVNRENMIIFAADDDLEFLAGCEHWFADGTFRVAPNGFEQLYTIHGFVNNEVFPAIYALLSERTEQAYEQLLHEILLLHAGLDPVSVLFDFELAAIRAFQSTFPGTTITGCMFHFGQCIWRKLQSEGLSERYRDEPEFALLVKRLLALAFIPTDDVMRVFEILTADPAYRQIEVICDYMKDNFIGRQRRGRRGQPRFAIQLWNQYSRVIDNLPRSNNSLEGWHNAFNNVVGFAHPSIAKLARKLQQEQHSMQIHRRQLALGTITGKKKKIYARINEALHTIAVDYSNRDPITYLGDIARVLNINVT